MFFSAHTNTNWGHMDFSLVLLASGLVSTVHAAHYEGIMFYGCFESCDCQVQFQWDGDQVMFADFKSGRTVWTAPLMSELEKPMSEGFYILAQDSKLRLCKHYLSKATQIDKNPTEEKALPVKPDASGPVVCLSVGVICLTAGIIIFIISANDSLRHRLCESWQTAFHRVPE
ncbi:RLA class II histocompatibility antigen%2C DP alpha-1 chain-like isoform X2 [Scomber scombrus]|uniref:RLA class II histocompatibility antigen, DP alpha-1 chain-like isoform X2 n=1 Tax=Scomber scombrus TaxID=13677 RepID=A0AAV1QBW1_SCOSC